MADAHETAGHHVQEEAPEEFVGVQRHDLSAVVVRVILPPEADAPVGVLDEPIVRQRDAMGVPPKVLEHLVGAGEGALGIHDPVERPQPTEEAGEGPAIGQRGGAAREDELAVRGRPLQAGEILRTKDRRQGPDRKQKRRSPADPARPISGQGAPGHEAMQMEVLREGLAPRVEIAVMPIVPPRWRGSRPKVSSVSAAARKRSA